MFVGGKWWYTDADTFCSLTLILSIKTRMLVFIVSGSKCKPQRVQNGQENLLRHPNRPIQTNWIWLRVDSAHTNFYFWLFGHSIVNNPVTASWTIFYHCKKPYSIHVMFEAFVWLTKHHILQMIWLGEVINRNWSVFQLSRARKLGFTFRFIFVSFLNVSCKQICYES